MHDILALERSTSQNRRSFKQFFRYFRHFKIFWQRLYLFPEDHRVAEWLTLGGISGCLMIQCPCLSRGSSLRYMNQMMYCYHSREVMSGLIPDSSRGRAQVYWPRQVCQPNWQTATSIMVFSFFCHVIFLEDNALTPLERELESHLCQTMSWVSDIGSPKANIFPLQGVDISPLASTRDQLLSMCVYHDTPALTALYISRTIH